VQSLDDVWIPNADKFWLNTSGHSVTMNGIEPKSLKNPIFIKLGKRTQGPYAKALTEFSNFWSMKTFDGLASQKQWRFPSCHELFMTSSEHGGKESIGNADVELHCMVLKQLGEIITQEITYRKLTAEEPRHGPYGKCHHAKTNRFYERTTLTNDAQCFSKNPECRDIVALAPSIANP